MDQVTYAQVQQAFDAARHLKGPARAAALDATCGDNRSLRAQVESLLEVSDADAHAGDPFSEAAIQGSRQKLEQLASTTDRTPERIGRYAIVRCMGEGGMGAVYEAMQDSPRRRVALKLIHPMLATPQRLKRFRHEAEILGRLHHPGIAQVYEAGTFETGHGRSTQPYFAMECIDGVDIRTHAQRLGLDARACLALVAKVCDAIEHAHKLGIVHRDIKPENILVDAQGQPKVLDFGIARVHESATLAITAMTEQGQIIGTLAYMSPEQLGGRENQVGPRSDIYALGVLAFELLAGRLPVNVAGLPASAAIVEIVDGDTIQLGGVDRALRGDVETIVAKAMEKDATRRYPSAAAMATDIRRFLDHLPIAARPASRGYLAAKFVRRHRGLSFGVGAAILALAAGLAGTAWGLLGQRTARLAAEHNELEARQARMQEQQAKESAQRERDVAMREAYVANINAAGLGLASAEGNKLRERLQACPPALRGWEWDHLKALDDPSLGAISGQFFTSVSCHPKGGRLATGDSRGGVRLWNARSLTATGLWSGHQSVVYSVKFSPDGTRLVSSSEDGTARVWDSSSGECLAVLAGHTGRVHEASFSADGSRVITASFDGTSRVFDSAGGQALHTLAASAASGEWIVRAGFIASTSRAFTSSFSGHLVEWDTDTGAKVRVISRERDQSYSYAAVSRDGTLLAGVIDSSAVRIASLIDGTERFTLRGHRAEVQHVEFSADGHLLLTSSTDASTRLWDTRTGRCIKVLFGHRERVAMARFSPDESRIWSASDDSTVRVWSVADCRDAIDVSDDPTVTVGCIAVSRQEHPLIVADIGRQIALVDPRTRAIRFDPSRALARRAIFSPDGKWVAHAGQDMDARLFRVGDISDIRTLRGHAGRCLSIHFSPSGTRIVTGSIDRTARIWDATSGELLGVLEGHVSNVSDAVFSPDCTRVATASDDQTLGIWDWRSQRRLLTMTGHAHAIHCVAFDHMGERVVSGSVDRTARIWDAQSGSLLCTLRGHAAAVESVEFSPDGSRVLTASTDGTARLWDAASGAELAAFMCPQGAILQACFTADGERIIVGDRQLLLRPFDTVPARVRLAAGDDATRRAQLMEQWRAECRGVHPATWLSDPMLTQGRPDAIGEDPISPSDEHPPPSH
jgi:WD40 repeat protein/tRNA A-37 threonylcarbamoyl transferase component Bud32